MSTLLNNLSKDNSPLSNQRNNTTYNYKSTNSKLYSKNIDVKTTKIPINKLKTNNNNNISSLYDKLKNQNLSKSKEKSPVNKKSFINNNNNSSGKKANYSINNKYFNNISAHNKQDNLLSKKISNKNSLSKSKERVNTSNKNINSTVINVKRNINSLQIKYENLMQKSSKNIKNTQYNKSSHIRNKSKESIKSNNSNLSNKKTYKSNNNELSNTNNKKELYLNKNDNKYSNIKSIYNNFNKLKHENNTNKSIDKKSKENSPISRSNNFKNIKTTTTTKLDFRNMNTSPLLLGKSKKQYKPSLNYLNNKSLNKNKLNKSKDLDSEQSKLNTSNSLIKTTTSESNKSKLSNVNNSTLTYKHNSLIKKLINKENTTKVNNNNKIDLIKENTQKINHNKLNSSSSQASNNNNKFKSNNTLEESKHITNTILNNKSIDDIIKGEQLNCNNFKQRIIDKVYEISRIGFTPGIKKVNQDNYFIFENFLDNPDFIYLAVCDGHGVNGHFVSKYLRDNLPQMVNKNWLKEIKRSKYSLLSKEVYSKLIVDSFVKVNNSIVNDLDYDTTFSGSTCISLIYNIDYLICVNLGDSRCTLGRCTYNNSSNKKQWSNIDLSRDHKPNEPDELKRIHNNNGRSEPYYDDNGDQAGPYRVWVKDYDYPGLAMSRSFGDEVAASVGVSCIPEIVEWKLTKDDKFVVLASDGLWEFMESSEVVDIVKNYYINKDIQGAAENLVKQSSKKWIEVSNII